MLTCLIVPSLSYGTKMGMIKILSSFRVRLPVGSLEIAPNFSTLTLMRRMLSVRLCPKMGILLENRTDFKVQEIPSKV